MHCILSLFYSSESFFYQIIKLKSKLCVIFSALLGHYYTWLVQCTKLFQHSMIATRVQFPFTWFNNPPKDYLWYFSWCYVDEYFLSRLPIVEKRLAQGGVRLAAILNRIFTSKTGIAQAWRVKTHLRGSSPYYIFVVNWGYAKRRERPSLLSVCQLI